MATAHEREHARPPEDERAIVAEFHELVNMPASTLEDWHDPLRRE